MEAEGKARGERPGEADGEIQQSEPETVEEEEEEEEKTEPDGPRDAIKVRVLAFQKTEDALFYTIEVARVSMATCWLSW